MGKRGRFTNSKGMRSGRHGHSPYPTRDFQGHRGIEDGGVVERKSSEGVHKELARTARRYLPREDACMSKSEMRKNS